MKFLKFWFPVILYSGIIFYVSSISFIPTPLPGMHFDKVFHVLEYMPFGYLVAQAICGGELPTSWKITWIWVLLVSFVHGVGDEYHQSFVPGRNVEALDAVMDTIGGVIGGHIYLLFKNKNRST